ncbi:hypothetical protein [Burkholderia sp. B21-005]|uniref:hypothetical protein n=1 Tax=Burkholderia sp. B21-005 TaxID=2890406 RepID=UPI001E36D601|nr:hypothetical protein [Burkholderia sp. B21-005]UEP40687.1 hypothetical protein LMA02_12705 [Burkholderia sp. B21-005]
MSFRRMLLLAVAATLILVSALATAAPVDGNPCGGKDPQQVERESVYCGDNAACIAREMAGLPEAQRSLECETRRLSPANVLNVPAVAMQAPTQ